MPLISYLPHGLKPGDSIKNKAGVVLVFLAYSPGVGTSRSRENGTAFDPKTDLTRKIFGYEKWAKQEPVSRCCYKDEKGRRCEESAVGLHDIYSDGVGSAPMWVSVPLCGTHIPWTPSARRKP